VVGDALETNIGLGEGDGPGDMKSYEVGESAGAGIVADLCG
jgi:hypothetical protein